MELSGDCGSGGPPRLRVYLTGFGPFNNVSDNPSATLVQQLAAALGSEQTTSSPRQQGRSKAVPLCFCPFNDPRDSPVPGAVDSLVETAPTQASAVVELCGWEVLEVSAEAATEAVPRIHSVLCRNAQTREPHEADAAKKFVATRETPDEPTEGPTDSAAGMVEEPLTLALHFGVSTHSDRWQLEACAKNDARFPCPDNRGCRPQAEVISDYMPLEACLRSSLCLEPVGADLSHNGFPCNVSDDAGCFVCNFLYFKSLYEGQRSGVASLFVHIPPFSAISLQQQLAAALRLLALLARKGFRQSIGGRSQEETLEKQKL
ncbi:chromatin organization modifier domain-containing protein, putative [Eimeria praecox]|uniref:Pyroglutamyl-peptidase I n=1 Tax=Eimeria praecox TaxID=51316 RepID=U6GAZ7_9EIME|nr:chromatin organization modifier domain-containing protein, putative [Eimeria praecox]